LVFFIKCYGDQIKEDEMSLGSMNGESENLKTRDNLGNISIDGRIILK
jgi:hypothetical protein